MMEQDPDIYPFLQNRLKYNTNDGKREIQKRNGPQSDGSLHRSIIPEWNKLRK